jgi:hypothetical protein
MELITSIIIIIGFGAAITSRLVDDCRRSKQREERMLQRTNEKPWNRNPR